MLMLDERDHKILAILQHDARCPIAKIASRVNLSVATAARRIMLLKRYGYIARYTILLDRGRINLSSTVYVMIETADQTPDWMDSFRSLIAGIPEIVEAHRLNANADYMLKVVLPHAEHWNEIYRKLIERLSFQSISAHISLEELDIDASLPTIHAGTYHPLKSRKNKNQTNITRPLSNKNANSADTFI